VWSPIPEEYLQPEYLNDLDNLPEVAHFDKRYVFKAEPDFDYAEKKGKGVMFDLWKQLYGFDAHDNVDINDLIEAGASSEELTSALNSKSYKPKPSHYHYFAYTAAAVLSGNVAELDIDLAYKKHLDGASIVETAARHGVWGIDDPHDPRVGRRKYPFMKKFAPLYARMFNNDLRFFSEAECMKTYNTLYESNAELTTHSRFVGLHGLDYLHTVERESPIIYCSHCRVITVPWENKDYAPGDEGYDRVLLRLKEFKARNRYQKHTDEDQTRYMARVVKLGYTPKNG
jgi:hypothetical protein